MRSYVASAILAAVSVVTPVATGYAPALSQDFSITNQVESTGLPPGWIKQLQAWWDVHAYYPKDASEKDEAGTVKIHLVIHPNGNVWTVEVVQSSGSRSLDTAGFSTFHHGYLRPFPSEATAPPADVTISLHYVLTHRHDQPVVAGNVSASSKSPFTITNDPVQSTVFNTMLQRTCSGTAVRFGWRNQSIYGFKTPYIFGQHMPITAIFYRKPDGTSWVRFWSDGGIRVEAAVTDIGKAAQWQGRVDSYLPRWKTLYTVWPDGDNRLSGELADPPGTIDLTCETEVVPAITPNAWSEVR